MAQILQAPSLSQRLIITGPPGSPYTRKVIAAARYCGLPYRLISDLSVIATLPQPKIRLWPVCYFPVEDGPLVPEIDSTPLLRKFDKLAPHRRLSPVDPRLTLIDALIEDFADEWLTKPMYHYRWTYEADILKARQILPNWFENPLTDEALRAAGDAFAERQIGRLGIVGSNSITAAAIESSFVRIITCLEQCLTRAPFILGTRPGPADYGLYGQLTQAALFDPTPRDFIERNAPRLLAWTIAMEDLSGLEDGEWTTFENLPETVHALLNQIGQTHVRLLIANEEAIGRGQKTLCTTIAGGPWEQPVFPYHLKCLTALRALYGSLSISDKASIEPLLRETGCMPLFENGPVRS